MHRCAYIYILHINIAHNFLHSTVVELAEFQALRALKSCTKEDLTPEPEVWPSHAALPKQLTFGLVTVQSFTLIPSCAVQPHYCYTTFTTSQWIRDKILSKLALLTETQAIYPVFYFFPRLIFFIKFWKKIY